MKHFVFILLCFYSLSAGAQTYAKAWDALEARMKKGEEFTIEELSSFVKKYEKDLESHPKEKSILYDGLGINYYSDQKYGDAIFYFEGAIELSNAAKDTVYRALYTFDLASLYNHIGYYTKAEPLFIKCLPTLSAYYGQSSLEYTLRFKVLAQMYVEMGNYYYARSMNDALLNYFKTLYGEKDKYYLVCLNTDAQINQGEGKYEKALEIFTKLIGLHESLSPIDTNNYITSLNNAAEAYRVVGKYDEALKFSLKAKSVADKFSNVDKLDLASIHNSLGLIYEAMGDAKQSEDNYDKSIAIYKFLKLEYSPDYTNPLNNKANLYRSLGRSKQAMDLLMEVIHIRKESIGTHHANYANAINNVGLIYCDQYMYKEALPYLLEAKNIYKELLGEEHQFYANILNNLASTYAHLKQYKEAKALSDKALEIIKRTVGEEHERYAYFLGNTIAMYDGLGMYDKAIQNIEKSNAIILKKFGAKHTSYIDGLYNIAYFDWKLKNYSGAKKYYIDALARYKEQFDNYFESMSENEQLQFYDVLGERFEYFNSFVFTYVSLFPKEDHSELLTVCFNYQLFLKSILLNNNINARREILSSKDTSLVNTYNKWIEAKQLLSSSFRDLSTENKYWSDADMELYANKLEEQLKKKSKLFSSNTTVTFKNIQSKLQANEAAINIIRAQKNPNDTVSNYVYAAFILKKNSPAPVFVRITNSKEFETDYVTFYNDQIESKKEDKLSYNRFWKQIAAQIPGVTKIYLSPDGIYNQVNLYTLLNPTTNKYVIDETSIAVLPNLTYILNNEKSNPNNTAQLFGFPDYEFDFSKNKHNVDAPKLLAVNRFGFSELPALPGTKTEVENISASLEASKWKVNAYTKEQASEEQLKKVNSPKVLHIATHGFFLKNLDNFGDDKSILGFETTKLRENPLLRSGIMMAGASVVARDTMNTAHEQDGIFTAYEASLLNLSNTDLVVLSACETGLGVSINNQGVFGLQRAFYIAGAKNLIMSLWVVDDDATQILMSEFYKEWSLNPAKENISKAFNKAQLEVRKKYPHPYYWGAFTLLGT